MSDNNKTKEEKIKEAISSTGFIVEYEVSQTLENKGWRVITNRYYLDDTENKPREIDLLAYKNAKIDKINYYFTLLISCKKSQTDDWVLITKDYKEDVNFTKFPFHYWTNDRILEKRMKEDEFFPNYVQLIQKNKVARKICDYERNVFAFQQINSTTQNSNSGKNKKHNDGEIYNSVTTLLKAAEYEMKILPDRKRNKSIYYFDLLSVFDGSLYEAHCCANNEIEIKSIKEAKYVNRFIINNKEDFYRVNFTTLEYLNDYLTILDKYADDLIKYLSNFREEYFSKGLFKIPYYNSLFIDDVKQEIERELFHSIDKYYFSTNEGKMIESIVFNEDKFFILIKDIWENELELFKHDNDLQKSIEGIFFRYFKFKSYDIITYSQAWDVMAESDLPY